MIYNKSDPGQRPVAAPETIEARTGLKWFITVLYTLALLPLVPMSVFILIGGFVFFFDSSPQSFLGVLLVWSMVAGVVIAPTLLVTSTLLVWRKSVWWFLLGVPSFMLAAAFGVGIIFGI